MFSKQTITCPFCLTEVLFSLDACSNPSCQRSLPVLYKRNYRAEEKVIVSAVGFRGHGKTVYLASLISILDRLSEFWPGYFRQALNIDSIKTIEHNRSILENMLLPPSTPRNFTEPSIHRLENVPDFGHRKVLIFDTAGEDFKRVESIQRNASFVLNSPTVLFFFSLPALAKDENDPLKAAIVMQELLQIYILGMDKLGGKTLQQHLVVIFTWGDVLQKWLKDYPDILDYLNKDELAPNWNMKQYLQNMKRVSNHLHSFTRTKLNATGFLNLARDKFASVEFCVTSALGNPPVDGHLTAKISSRRVIDPLLWVMDKSSRRFFRW